MTGQESTNAVVAFIETTNEMTEDKTMKKRNNLIALALLLASLLCLCAGCKSELDGNDGESSGMTLSQAVKYIKQATDGTIKIKVTGEMTKSDTRTLCYSISAAASGVLVELDMSEVTGLETTTEQYTIDFKNCTKLVGISLPETLVVVGSEAFSGCTSLKSVAIPSSVTLISSSAFSGCSSLKQATFADTKTTWYSSKTATFSKTASGVKELGAMSSPSANAKLLIKGRYLHREEQQTESTDSSGTTTTGGSTTTGGGTSSSGTGGSTTGSGDTTTSDPSSPAVDLTHMTVEEAIAYINAMADGESATLCIVDATKDNIAQLRTKTYKLNGGMVKVKVTIDLSQSTGLTEIPEDAFRNCSSLAGVTFPNSITAIGKYAFQYCTSLTSVKIPEGVTTIGQSAFENCESLTSVTIPSSVTAINNQAFFCDTSLATITYLGTKEQWGSITLGTYWRSSWPEVHCTDGDVEL